MLPLLLLALPAGPVCVQEVELPETVVMAPRSGTTATTTSAKVTVLTGEDLRDTGQTTLPRALGEAAGVWIQETNTGGGAPVVRGLLGNQILILVDGVRLNDSTTRYGPNQSLNTIDPHIVDRVEVIRGPASVLYGSDAIGGVILIWTKRRRPGAQDARTYELPIGGGMDLLYDSAVDGGRLSLNLSGAMERHGLLGVGSLHAFEDLETGDGGTYPHTGFHGHALFGAYEHAIGEGETLRLTSRFNRDFNVPRTDKLVTGYGQSGPSNEDYRYSLQDRRGFLASYTDTELGGFADRLQIRANLHTYVEQRDTRKTGAARHTFEEDSVDTVGIGVDWQKVLRGDHRLTCGLDLGRDEVDSLRRDYQGGVVTPKQGAFAPDSRYTRAGLFLQDELLGLDPWFFTAGVRFSYYDFSFRDTMANREVSGDFDALTASLEAARELGGGVTLTGSLAQGYRAPNLDDLANEKEFGGGKELPNPNLGAEKSLTAELGLAVHRNLWEGTLAVFATEIDDYVGRVLEDEGGPGAGDEEYRRENTGTVELVGTEASARCRLLTADSPFAVSALVSYVRGTQEDPSLGPDEVPAQRVPPLNGRVGLHFEPAEPWLSLDFARLFVHWADEQHRLHPQDLQDPRIDPGGTAGWATFNLDFGGSGPNSDWWIGLYNLTDERYRVHSSGVDAPGARIVVGVRVQV